LEFEEEKKRYNDIEKSVLKKYKAQLDYQTLSKTKFVMAINNQSSAFDLNHIHVSKKSESGNRYTAFFKQHLF